MAKSQQTPSQETPVLICVECVHCQPGAMTGIFGEDHGCGAAEASGVDPVNGQPISLGCRAMRSWGPCGPQGKLWKAAKE